MSQVKMLEHKLNAPTPAERLQALQELMTLYNGGIVALPTPTQYVNNHIHTSYSFSPYSPTSAAYTAWKTGLVTAGIVDHDSVAGAKEFIAAGEILGLAVTVGVEMRCTMAGTPFAEKRLNNTDQTGVAYVTMQGIPHQNIDEIQGWITPYREKREQRNRKMVEKINQLLRDPALHLEYAADIRSISRAAEGGSVTERHILYALAQKMTQHIGKGKVLLAYLSKELSIEVAGKNLQHLQDESTPYYEYYLLGVLKSSLVEQFYIDATDECPPLADFVTLANRMGAIPTYPYLGDVGESITGDKAAQAFEDSFLDELIPWLKQAGFPAIAYMPTRNTPEQLERLGALLQEQNLFPISGEDINTPFQSFVCLALDKPEFKQLITSTWALIGHELLATGDIRQGMFEAEALAKYPDLQDRTTYYANYALQHYNKEH